MCEGQSTLFTLKYRPHNGGQISENVSIFTRHFVKLSRKT